MRKPISAGRSGDGGVGSISKRREKRQEKGLLKKKKKQANQLRKVRDDGQDARAGSERRSGKADRDPALPKKRREESPGSEGGRTKKRSKLFTSSTREPSSDAFIDFEEMEIKRLEKLLGINKMSKNSSSQKLNDEYSKYEGIGDDFGDFLMRLDNISHKDRIFDEKDYNYDSDEVEELQDRPHIIDDDEQEKSDIEEEIDQSSSDDDDDDDDEEDDEDIEDDGENEESEGDAEDEERYEEAEDDEDASDENEDAAGSDSESDSDIGRKDVDKEFTYKPVSGEDIYGRVKVAEGSTSSAKYVPPALRNQSVTLIDETSDKNRVLKMQINGLLNRISDNTKDTVIRELKDIFQSNSTSVVNYLLRDTLSALCSSKTQIISYIPLYASIVAALHFVIGLEVGAFIVEFFAVELHKMVENERNSKEKSKTVSKLPCNYLLLLLYLYNYRTIHHSLIVDILNYLVADADVSRLTSLDIELVAVLIDHSGVSIRSDDPLSLKTSVINLNKISANISSLNPTVDNGRVRFLLDIVTDLKNNKSRRSQSANADVVKNYRKWLGSIKTSLSSKPGDLMLRVAFKDLLDAEQRGRWWRAGGAWVGNSTAESADKSKSGGGDLFKKGNGVKTETAEEKKLLKVAAKLRMNTATRKNIFVLIMSSNDVNDAYEKLARLDLKGKQDRDIVKVLCECCAQEKLYNEFYAELSCLLCKENRQFRTTFQFTFWDTFKSLSEEETKPRRCINMGRLLARLVTTFNLPLSVIKPIDMSDLSSSMQLFLGSFFMALFTSSISEDEYQAVLDRVATTKDYSVVREGILMYLQTQFTTFPDNSDSETLLLAKKRRKLAIATMQSMEVLDFVGNQEGNDHRSDNRGGGADDFD